MEGGGQEAKAEKKQSGNGVALDLPRLRHPHPLPRPLRLPRQVPRTRPATVGPALAAMTPTVNPESILRKGKRRNTTKRKGRKRSDINIKRTKKPKEEKKTQDLFRYPSI